MTESDDSSKAAGPRQQSPVTLAQTEIAIAACLQNAGELLTAAAAILEREQLPAIAFHLGVIALEEVGKASLFRVAFVAYERDREAPPFVLRWTGDHVRKLFWAIWGQTIGREIMTKAQIEQLQGLATRLHEKRLRSLYVDVATHKADGGFEPVDRAIPAEQVVSLLRLVRARLEIEKAYGLGPLPVERQAIVAWFIEATEKPDSCKLVMGTKSMEKLAELGNSRDWITWLKEQFDAADHDARRLAERELQRQPPTTEDEQSQLKWRMKFRLHTQPHSIRASVLRTWNDGMDAIKLHPVTGGPGKKSEIIVELLMPKEISVHALWPTSLDMASEFVVALNVGSLGFFWWHLPTQTAQFYDSLMDLESGSEVRIQRAPGLSIDWRRGALDDRQLTDVMTVLAVLSWMRTPEERKIVQHYRMGLIFLAKTDVHMQFEANAYAEFYSALHAATRRFSNDDRESVSARIKNWMRQILSEADEGEQLVTIGESLLAADRPSRAISLEDVGKIKVLCDLYIIEACRRRIAARASGQSPSQQST